MAQKLLWKQQDDYTKHNIELWTGFFDEGYTLMDNEDAHFFVREMTSEDALALANVILDDQGLGWLPYPENKPECGEYQISMKCDWDNQKTFVTQGEYDDDLEGWTMYWGSDIDSGFIVIAFRLLPEPYQPEDKDAIQ